MFVCQNKKVLTIQTTNNIIVLRTLPCHNILMLNMLVCQNKRVLTIQTTNYIIMLRTLPQHHDENIDSVDSLKQESLKNSISRITSWFQVHCLVMMIKIWIMLVCKNKSLNDASNNMVSSCQWDCLATMIIIWIMLVWWNKRVLIIKLAK